MNNKLATETCVDYKINSRAEQMSTDLKTKTWFFRNGTAIANNTNLNSLTTCGTYNEDSSTNATTLVNCPTKYAFSMNVFDTTGHATHGDDGAKPLGQAHGLGTDGLLLAVAMASSIPTALTERLLMLEEAVQL